MKVVQRDVWLCDLCMQAAVNDDFSSVDYFYPPGHADKMMNRIKKGLHALGPGLVPDFREETELECSDCGHTHTQDYWTFVEDEFGEKVPVCKCGSFEIRERDHGEEEFSRRDCDCCGTDLAGYRARFAILGD